MFDINGLKDINDHSGHDKGDKEIIKASRLLMDAFPDERIFRIGGDEFVVIIGQSGDYAAQLMGKCTHLISKASTDENIRVLMSTGYSELDSFNDKTYQDTFERADKAMYENKKAYYETLGNRRHR